MKKTPYHVMAISSYRAQTPSLLSLIINNKFANHLPVERQVKEMKYCGINLGTNTVSNWMIKASEYYLTHIYYELHSQLIKGSDVIHADETPFEVIQDGRRLDHP